MKRFEGAASPHRYARWAAAPRWLLIAGFVLAVAAIGFALLAESLMPEAGAVIGVGTSTYITALYMRAVVSALLAVFMGVAALALRSVSGFEIVLSDLKKPEANQDASAPKTR